ncbi:MAG: hypothetical protein ROM03_03640 [Mucispirillum sp.]|nr:hypothetical protein [Mucispirillum sp.]
MELSKKEKEKLTEVAAPIITSVVAGTLVSAALAEITKLLATNVHKSNVFGNKVTAPTEDKTVLSNRETKGDNIDSSLSTDEVSAQQGEIKAAKQEGKASTTEATASEAGATASRAKGGASDIETKALKIT